MIFQELPLQGAFLITFEPHHDQRGFFARTFCKKTFAESGLHTDFKQDSLSWNTQRGTLRGLHYQDPQPEVKIVQCLQGEIFDVLVDVRKGSPTFGKWASVILNENKLQALYIPAGFAHGFQTLQDNTLLQYKISEDFVAEAARGIRWDDPALKITWPLPVSCISERDTSYNLFTEE